LGVRPVGRPFGSFLRRAVPESDQLPDWLAAVRNWAPAPVPEPEPWYAAEKREQGSFATLAGLELRRSQRTTGWAWRAIAVGDSCLFHVRGAELALSFPIASAREFGNRPALVPSSTAWQCPKPGWCVGRARPDDLFLLATDAAAARLLDPEAFAAALTAARAALATHDSPALADWCRTVQDAANDDVSVLAFSLPRLPEPS
jgi:hypothetical protein